MEECQRCGELFIFEEGGWIGDPFGRREYVCKKCKEWDRIKRFSDAVTKEWKK